MDYEEDSLDLFGEYDSTTTEQIQTTEDIDDDDDKPVSKDFVLKVNNTHHLVTYLLKFFNNKEYSDVTFEIEGKSLYSHKFILAARGKKFESLFKDGSSTYKIENHTYQTFSSSIQFIYTGKIDITKQNSENTLLCADAYGIDGLKSLCFDFIVKSLDKDSVISTLMKAKRKEFKYDATILVDKCLTFLEDQASDIISSKQFLDFDEELVTKVCQNTKIAISELDLFNGVVRWGKEQIKLKKESKLQDVLKNILPHIRFPQIQEDDLNSVVLPTDLMTNDDYNDALDFQKNPDNFKKKTDLRYTARSCVFLGSTLLTTKDSILLDQYINKKGKPWKLLYKATKDGFSASKFHTLCDNKGETVSIVKSTNGNIFGGFTAKAWNQSGNYESESTAFLFSFVNSQKMPYKFTIKTTNVQYAQLGSASYGPTFGGGHDFMICSDSNTVNSSYSNFGHTYDETICKQTYNQIGAKNFFAGSYNFKTLEVEVFGRS